MTADGLLGGLGAVLLLGGCALASIGLLGLLLKPDIFDQLHVAGLVTGPGVVLVLLGSIGTGRAEIMTSAILVLAFVLVTASISTHVIAHAGVRRYGSAGGTRTRRGGALVSPAAVGAIAADAADEHRSAAGLRVVVAYDGSEGARLAAQLAKAIDWPAGSHIRFVGAAAADELPPIDPWRRHDPGVRPEEEHETALQAAARSVERPGIDVETVVLRGDAADVIVEETATFDADLLITGTRQRSFVQSLLGTSAAGDIVDRAPCPVLVARSTSLGAALLTTDGSPASDAATEIVAAWPIFDLVRIHVATVHADPGASTDAPGATEARDALVPAPSPGPGAQRAVDATAARLMDAGREVVRAVLRGTPAPAIVEAAQARAVDLIVIGSRGRTGLGRTLLGSVAGEVLAAAPCSVLIVGPPRRRPPGGA